MHEQENISAALDPSQAHPRFPGPFQDQERSGDPPPPSGQGPQAPGRLGFPPARRLRAKSQYEAVFASGRRYQSRHFVLYALARPDDGGGVRLGLVVSRKCGHAVWRNRIKRVLRELFRLQGSDFGYCADIAVIAKKHLDPRTLDLHMAKGELLPVLEKIGAALGLTATSR